MSQLNEMKKSKNSKRKKTIIIVVSCVIIVLIIAGLILYFHYRSVDNAEAYYSPESITESDADNYAYEDEAPDAAEESPEVQSSVQDEWNHFIHQKHIYHDENGNPDTQTGVAKATFTDINANPQYYYFDNGVWDQTYTGLSRNVNYDPEPLYYVVNGVVDKKYIGFVENDGFRYYVKNGTVQRGFNGKLILNGKTYHITNGVDDASR